MPANKVHVTVTQTNCLGPQNIFTARNLFEGV